MQFAAYALSPEQTPKQLINLFKARAHSEGWLVQDIDPDEAIHWISETDLTPADVKELIRICDEAIVKTNDTIVKRPHWLLVKTWIEENKGR